jgi:hypothetical protein
MDDFQSWSHANLATLASDQQSEIVRLNNENCETLRVLKELADEFAYQCDLYCKKPVRFAVYRAAMEKLK